MLSANAGGANWGLVGDWLGTEGEMRWHGNCLECLGGWRMLGETKYISIVQCKMRAKGGQKQVLGTPNGFPWWHGKHPLKHIHPPLFPKFFSQR